MRCCASARLRQCMLSANLSHTTLSATLGQSCLLLIKLLPFAGEEYPKTVGAQHGAERDIEQIQETEDESEDSGPRPIVEQDISSQHTGQGEQQAKSRQQGAQAQKANGP